MMPHNSKRLVALFLSLVMVFHSIACGWGYYMGYDMLFDRAIVFNKSQKNATYNAWYYNQELYNYENQQLENAENWSDFLEGAYRKEDLIPFIYRGDIKFNTRDKEILSLRRNRLHPLKSPSKESQFVDCILFALRVEILMEKYQPDPWDDSPQKINLADFTPLINIANARINSSQDQFLKERYAFQLIKLLRYSKQYNLCTTSFKKHFTNKTSMISFWAMEHFAGALAMLNKQPEANYYFAKVYLNCPQKRSSSYLSMKLSSISDFSRTLNLCQNLEEKMALYYIHAMQSKTLALVDLKEITENLGNHEYAQIIMSHELNKLEKILLNKSLNEVEQEEDTELLIELSELKNQTPAYLRELIKLNTKMLDLDDSSQFWHLSLAYLYYLNKKYADCSIVLSTIDKSTPEIQKQFEIIYLINYIDQHPLLNKAQEDHLGEVLFSLNNENPSYPLLSGGQELMWNYTNESFLDEEYNTINEFIFRKLAQRNQNKNSFLATIFSGKTFQYDLRRNITALHDEGEKLNNFLIDIADIDRIIGDIKRTPESKLSIFAASYYFQKPVFTYSDEDPSINKITFEECEQQLLELKATMLLRDPLKIDQCLDLYSKLPSSHFVDYVVYGNPFVFSAKTPNFSNHELLEDRLPKMTRLEFAQRIKKLTSSPMTAQNAFQVGVAYYNASYYGLQWKLLAYFRPYELTYAPNGNVDMKTAEKYLKMALSLGGLDRERQAQTYFMLARCEQNRYTFLNGEISENYYSEPDRFFQYFYKMKGAGAMSNFKKLANEYRTTALYNEIIRECKYFEYYLN